MRAEKTIGNKRCYLYTNGEADVHLIQAVDNHDLEVLDREVKFIKELAPGIAFTLTAFLIKDWNNELSPWEAPAVFGRKDFGAGADNTLRYITETLLPWLEENTGSDHKMDCFLGGYSLSGLFALWAAYQTDRFCGVAAVSPSVWFPGWESYMEARGIQTPAVYLSLGLKEEKARNKIMSTLGTHIRRQYELLRSTDAVDQCTLEWNPGNHFVDSDLRTAKGFAWLLNQRQEGLR